MLDNLRKMRKSLSHYTLFREQEIPFVAVKGSWFKAEYSNFDWGKYENLSLLENSDEDQDRYWVRSCLNELVNRDKNNDEYFNQLNIEAGTLIKISERLKQPMTSYYNSAQKIVELIWDEGDST